MNPSPTGWPRQVSATPQGWRWPAANRRVIAGDQWPALQRLYQIAGTTPSLDLNFARTKTLNDAITGRNLVTFTRVQTTSNGSTYVAADGLIKTAASNEPRFQHNPTTGESLGLLVEEPRTNLRTFSDAMLVANVYGATNSTLATVSTVTPTGSTTASLFTLNVGANTGNNTDGFNFSSSITLANSTQHTQSLFVKPAGATVLRLRSNTSGLVVDFTLTGNGTAPSISGDLQSASIVPYANGWYRVSWTFTTTTSVPGNRSDYWTIKTNVADGTNGFYVVGAQLEAGAFATSYIPTTTATVTRAADVASITGASFSSFYNQTEGTVFIEGVVAPVLSRFPPEWTLSDGTDTNRIESYNYASGYGVTVRQSGQTNTDPVLLVTPVSGTPYKKAVALKISDYRVAAQGQQNSSPNATFMPTVNQMQIGTSRAGVSSLSSTIKRLTFWPTRLSNTTLQQITQP
jgi:hypothetical protein